MNEESFKTYMNTIENITGITYLHAIKKISEYLSKDGKSISCYHYDKKELKNLIKNLSPNGKEEELGKKSNNTNLNAIKKLLKFREYLNNNPDFINLSPVQIVNYEYEKDLEKALYYQYKDYFPNYELYTGINKTGNQVRISTKEGKTKIVDLILANKNEILVIELKKGHIDRDSFAQVTDYMVLLQEKHPKSKIKGAIIGSNFEEHFLEILKTSKFEISLYKYQLKIKLEKIK